MRAWLVLLLPVLAFADEPNWREPWTVESANKRFALRYELGVYQGQRRGWSRLTLRSGEKELWTVDADRLPHQRALVSEDGRRVVVAEGHPSGGVIIRKDGGLDADLDEPILAILGENGAVVRSLALPDLCDEAQRSKLMYSVSHVTWLDDMSLDPAGVVLMLKVRQSGQLFGSKAPPVERRVQLSDGAVR